MHRQQGVMEMGLFQKVVDECAALGITHVRVHNYGEPFLDRQLVEKVRYAKSRGIREVGMISNGSLITEEIAAGMIDAGLDAINISVDAGGKETFERTRVHLDYDTVIGNIRTLVRLRGERGRTHPKLILSFVRQDNSSDEQGFIREWSQVADKIHVTDLHNWAGTLNDRSDVHYPCYRLWLTFTVLWDGRVSLCCADFDGRHILGDLRTSTIDAGMELAGLPRRPPPAARERRPRDLPHLRPAQERLAALGQAHHLKRGQVTAPGFQPVPWDAARLSPCPAVRLAARAVLYSGEGSPDANGAGAGNRGGADVRDIAPGGRAVVGGRPDRRVAGGLADGRSPGAPDEPGPERPRHCGAAPVASGQRELRLSFEDHRVSLKAQNVTVREILSDWQRQSGCQFVNADKIAGGPVTLEFNDQPELQVIDSLLRDTAGYVVAPRSPSGDACGVVYILASSHPTVSAGYTPSGISPVAAPLMTPRGPEDEIPPVMPPAMMPGGPQQLRPNQGSGNQGNSGQQSQAPSSPSGFGPVAPTVPGAGQFNTPPASPPAAPPAQQGQGRGAN